APAAPRDMSDLTGTWALDPRRTTVEFQTKHTWALNVSGTLRATEGSGIVDDGQVTGRLVVDAGSIDTKNKVRDARQLARRQRGRPDDLRASLPAAMSDGRFRAAPSPQVVGSGLGDLQHALDIQRAGVSARKVVVTLCGP